MILVMLFFFRCLPNVVYKSNRLLYFDLCSHEFLVHAGFSGICDYELKLDCSDKGFVPPLR